MVSAVIAPMTVINECYCSADRPAVPGLGHPAQLYRQGGQRLQLPQVVSTAVRQVRAASTFRHRQTVRSAQVRSETTSKPAHSGDDSRVTVAGRNRSDQGALSHHLFTADGRHKTFFPWPVYHSWLRTSHRWMLHLRKVTLTRHAPFSVCCCSNC